MQRIKRENVASCYIFSKEKKVLLIHHKKMGKWVPPGGHIEENELPHEAAIREVFEEVGLKITLGNNSPISIDEWNAHSIPRPLFMLLENIPQFNDVPEHQHIDHIYMTLYQDENGLSEAVASETCQWFSQNEIAEMKDNQDIFSETKQILAYLFAQYGPFSA
ncbi:MAG: NUDIX domain-containing protein [Chlamydia sp.]